MMEAKQLNLFKGYHFPMKIYWDNYNNGGFTQLSLDLTSNCNYRCDWCFNKHLINKKTDSLSLKEKEKILKEAVKLGAKTLVFPGTGEPTLDPDFYPLVEIAHKLGLITVVYTNLTGNINPGKIKFLFDKNVSIGLKLDSLKPDYFVKRYHVDKSIFDKFQLNLKSVLKIYKNTEKIKGNHKIYRVIANMVLTEENKFEIETLSKFCKSENLPLFVRPVKPVNWAKQNFALWKKIGKKISKGIAINKDGKSTINPDEALSGALLPFGNYKGSALALAVEILTKTMFNVDIHDEKKAGRGYLFIFFNPSVFTNINKFKSNAGFIGNIPCTVPKDTAKASISVCSTNFLALLTSV